MANITEEVHFEMLEKKSDGSFKAKYPKVKSKSGVTFDEHLADYVQSKINTNNSLKNKANSDGDYPQLRARGTTKTDVGLGNVDNYSRDDYDQRYASKDIEAPSYLYALRGGNYQQFYRYDMSSSVWTELAISPAKVGGEVGGGALKRVGNHIYALRGQNHKDFYVYNINLNQWSELAGAPGTIGGGGLV